MILCIDVDYRDDHAMAAGVVIREWDDPTPVAEYTKRIDSVEPYESGKFYKRELPCIMKVLESVTEPIDTIVVDGHVWLEKDEPGLGAKLHEALTGRYAVVGVAKNVYRPNPDVTPVLRGTSKVPLFVSAIGVVDAPARVVEMHGPHRVPTILRLVDRLCRDS